MSLTLHGHHILLLATLAFVTAVLTPNWYTAPAGGLKFNVFQVCSSSSQEAQVCKWLFSPQTKNSTSISTYMTPIYPIATAACAIACAVLSAIGLMLGAWYVQRFASKIASKWLLLLTTVVVLLDFLLSSAVWVLMLTINRQHKLFQSLPIRLDDYGFSFWINIGSSVVYFVAVVMHLIAICQDS